MAQKYYEYSHYKERDEHGPQQRPPRGSHAPYLLVFQAIFYGFFHVSAHVGPWGWGGYSSPRALEPTPQSSAFWFHCPFLSQSLFAYPK